MVEDNQTLSETTGNEPDSIQVIINKEGLLDYVRIPRSVGTSLIRLSLGKRDSASYVAISPPSSHGEAEVEVVTVTVAASDQRSISRYQIQSDRLAKVLSEICESYVDQLDDNDRIYLGTAFELHRSNGVDICGPAESLLLRLRKREQPSPNPEEDHPSSRTTTQVTPPRSILYSRILIWFGAGAFVASGFLPDLRIAGICAVVCLIGLAWHVFSQDSQRRNGRELSASTPSATPNSGNIS